MSRGKVFGKGQSRGSPGNNHPARLFQAEKVLLAIFKGNTVNSQHSQLLAKTLDYIDWSTFHTKSLNCQGYLKHVITDKA